jgi:peptidoglycan hydrolase-like protein with peptidoglycan-binding domain
VIAGKDSAAPTAAGAESHAPSEVQEDAASSVSFSGHGKIPAPVAMPRDAAAPPSPSDLAFGEVAGAEDALASAGPTGTRFSGDGDLGDVERGRATLKVGDTGAAVRKVQQALFELNYRPIAVSGVYDRATVDQVQAYQQKQHLARQDGTLDRDTFSHIEQEFFDLNTYAKAAGHAPPGVHNTPKGTDAKQVPVLLAETRELDEVDKAEAGRVIKPSSERVGDFHEKIAAGVYGDRLEKLLLEKIAADYKDTEAAKHHHDHGKLFSMGEMVNVGNAAKEQVDKVFGSWAVGGTMKAGVTLKDRFEADTAAQSHMDATHQHREARTRARYLMNTSSSFEHLDDEHSADRTRKAEDGIIDRVIDKVATAKQKELLLITATWSAATEPSGIIKIQRMKSGDDDQDRDTLWKKFGTMIHEYIHSIAHPAWRAYKEQKAKADSQAGHVLTEGVTELLTRTVVSQIDLKDQHLHKQVLGKMSDDGELPDLGRDNKYGTERSRAEALVGVVGIHNLYAAYFLGETSLIGV